MEPRVLDQRIAFNVGRDDDSYQVRDIADAVAATVSWADGDVPSP